MRRNAKIKKSKQRLDLALVARGLVSSRQRAQAMIMAGQVFIDQQLARKPSDLVTADSQLSIFGKESKYASRAGLKLEGALAVFSVDANDRVCLDIGASNGGFTDCLLQRGARRVYAVDVNTNQLAWKLRRDSRVQPIRKNVRFLQPEDIPEPVGIVTVDVSFISVSKILSALVRVTQPGAAFLILVKPQFELTKNLVGKGGIVREPALHERAISTVRAAAEKSGLTILGVQPSQVLGAEGNQEFFLHACLDSVQSSEPHAQY